MSTQANNNSIDALNTENDNSIDGSNNNNDNNSDASNVGDRNNDFHAENLHRTCRICAKIIAENTGFY